MAYEFRLPDLGEGLTEAEIARWLVAEGEEVREDQPLVEVQTDKTTVEIPSPRGGTVLKVLVGEGDVAPVGAVLVVIGEEGEQLLRAVETPEPAASEAEGDGPLVAVVPPEPSDAVRATPAVRRLAKELDVALKDVPGTGPDGRIVEGDVRAAAAGAGVAERVPVRGVRRAIVEQVTRAHREVPAVTFVEECDFGGLDLRRMVPIAIHAAAASLRVYPELNARLVGDAAWHDELRRVDDDARPAAVPVQSELQDRQTGLRGNVHLHGRGQFERMGGGHLLVRQQPRGETTQTLACVARQARQERPTLQRVLPKCVGDDDRARCLSK